MSKVPEPKKEESKSESVKTVLAECQDYKDMYDKCFNQWYRHQFMKSMTATNNCDGYYEDYHACISTRLDKLGLGHLAAFDPKFAQKLNEQ